MITKFEVGKTYKVFEIYFTVERRTEKSAWIRVENRGGCPFDGIPSSTCSVRRKIHFVPDGTNGDFNGDLVESINPIIGCYYEAFASNVA